jgi:hypothetical protein
MGDGHKPPVNRFEEWAINLLTLVVMCGMFYIAWRFLQWLLPWV